MSVNKLQDVCLMSELLNKDTFSPEFIDIMAMVSLGLGGGKGDISFITSDSNFDAANKLHELDAEYTALAMDSVVYKMYSEHDLIAVYDTGLILIFFLSADQEAIEDLCNQ